MSQEPKEKVFADGFKFTPKRDDQPDFVVGKLDLELTKAIPFLKKNAKVYNTKGKDGEEVKLYYVNLEVKIGRSGNPYVELDTFVPQKKATEQTQEVQQSDSGLPF